MNFYERLTELVEKSGKSMNQIDRELNFPRNTISGFKNKKPSISRLNKIAEYFDVTTDYLIGQEPQTPEFSVIQRRAKELTPEQQRELIELMERAFNKLDKGELHLDESDDF
ncbi:helix-turn-helix domain-containing protein [Lactococcus petauri]|uniref:helix-turn-helix domain-containing protein n=1 Tax=Lactococcus petauri TaxID=1940789 RepID=UPI0038545F8A